MQVNVDVCDKYLRKDEKTEQEEEEQFEELSELESHDSTIYVVQKCTCECCPILKGELCPGCSNDPEFVKRMKDICDAKLKKKKKAHKYYRPAVIAKVDIETSYKEMMKLLRNGVRTFFIRLGCGKSDELHRTMLRINTVIQNFNMKSPYTFPIGVAMELHGYTVQTGRLRNNRNVPIAMGTTIILTCDEKYKFCSQQEILFITNLWRYIDFLKLGDVIFMNDNTIKLSILKILGQNITCCIEKGTELRSYMNVVLPYVIPFAFEPTQELLQDLEFAMQYEASFIVVPAINSLDYIKNFTKFLSTYQQDILILASMHLCLTSNDPCILNQILKACDGIWMDDLFKIEDNRKKFYVDNEMKCILELAKGLELPIIAKIPIKTCKDFHKLEHNENLTYLDGILLERSPLTLTFPIIAKKLFCIVEPSDDKMTFPPCKPQTHNSEMFSKLIKDIEVDKFDAILINSNVYDNLGYILSRKNIYCPIIVATEIELVGKKLNICRNIGTVLYKGEINNEYKRLEFGIRFARCMKLIRTGDMVLSIYDNIYFGYIGSKYRILYVPQEKIPVPAYNRIYEKAIVPEYKTKLSVPENPHDPEQKIKAAKEDPCKKKQKPQEKHEENDECCQCGL